MKSIQKIGVAIFVLGMVIFISTLFMGKFELTTEKYQELVESKGLKQEILLEALEANLVDKEFATSFQMSTVIIDAVNKSNDHYIALEQWDMKIHDKPNAFAYEVINKSGKGIIAENKGIFFMLTFGLCILGSLLFVMLNYKLLGPAGIKNNGIYQHSSTNKGWIAWIVFLFLFFFYVGLYFYPNFIVNWVYLVQPVKDLFGGESSQWFLYGVLYCVSMSVMGVRMIIKYRHNKYQIVRTISVVFFQVVFAFLLVEILPLFQLPAVDLKNAWPLDYDFLFDWNVKGLLANGNFGKFVFVWGIALAVVVIPVMVYFFGKRWYCSWVCGCGGLAETVGDPYRQHSNKQLWSWKMERWMIHLVLVFAVLMTVWTGYHTYQEIYNPDMDYNDKTTLLGISSDTVRSWYGFLIGSIFSGVIGTGFYPIFGNRVWCRIGCPLAAYMGFIQRFKSKFRITTNGGQCISCGNCSTYCEQGIDVRAYAQKGQNIVRSSCVGCGVCSAVCPRGVLKLENAPNDNWSRVENPVIMLGNDGLMHLNDDAHQVG
ncbi:MAG: 4Fe-4S binding protein [Flavobacteriales bacterium]|nr:4Fe-4S binding protein [Flavobacteriales bacterium]